MLSTMQPWYDAKTNDRQRIKARQDRLKSRYRKEQRTALHNKLEVQPGVVLLGSEIPSLRADVDYSWARPIGTAVGSSRPASRDNVSTVDRKNRYKNLFEYNKKHADTFDFKTKLWKIPSIGNNFLPFRGKGLHVSPNSEEVIGLYRPTFHRWYSRLVHENTIVLPPIETSQRVKENIHEPNNYNEKKYIDKERRTTGPRERFTRDELYLPHVYNQCFSCRECRKVYANEVFNQNWATRNSSSPLHTRRSGKMTSPQALDQRQHCDVLGERYCKDCIESRNKTFSLLIEENLMNNNNLTKIHYRNIIY